MQENAQKWPKIDIFEFVLHFGGIL